MPRNLDARHAALAAKAVAETITEAELREAQAMVDEVAKAAGYNVGPVWHYSPVAGIRSFQPLYRELADGTKTEAEVAAWLKHLRSGAPVGYMDFRSGTFFTPQRGSYQGYGSTEYSVYLKLDNPGIKVHGGRVRITVPGMPIDALMLDMEGDGIIREIAVIDPMKIKSADPFTFDDDDNLIPLSERFQADSPDIRYNPHREDIEFSALSPEDFAEAPDSIQNGWIAPDGTIYGWNEEYLHAKAIKDIHKLFGTKPSSFEKALAQGWVRLVTDFWVPPHHHKLGMTVWKESSWQDTLAKSLTKCYRRFPKTILILDVEAEDQIISDEVPLSRFIEGGVSVQQQIRGRLEVPGMYNPSSDGLRGEWWIDDSGSATFADGDIGDQNHEIIAFWSALGVDPDETFSLGEILPDEGLSEEQASGLLEMGADPKAVEFFSGDGGDARDFMMVERAWIRVADSNFQLWNLDDEALGRIRDFINNEYPEDEDPLEDTFEIEELRKGGVHLSVSGSDLLESGKSADALKYSGRRERTGMYNPPDLDTRHAELAAKAEAGVITQAELDEAQAMVDEVAKTAGYNIGPVWHGTDRSVTQFKTGRAKRGNELPFGAHFTESRDVAQEFTQDKPGEPNLMRVNLSLQNPINFSAGAYKKGTDQFAIIQTALERDRRTPRFTNKNGWQYDEFRDGDDKWLDTAYLSNVRGDIAKKVIIEYGYDGIEYMAGYSSEAYRMSGFRDIRDKSYIAFYPSQIKSADPFTFDDDDNLIPLSERFQETSPDIRCNPQTSKRTYYEIGHRGLKSKLWYGDEFNITVEPAEFDIDGKDVDPRNLHNEWALRMPWHGRYDPYSDEVSIMGGTMTEEWRQPSDRLLDLLREKFGADVKIVQFNSRRYPTRKDLTGFL